LSQVPNRIYLSGHLDDKTNAFYKTIFEDIVKQIGQSFTIKSQILDRLVEGEKAGTVAQLIAAFWGSPRRSMVQQLVDKSSAILSAIITDRWKYLKVDQLVAKL
jgi:hypothetical protein